MCLERNLNIFLTHIIYMGVFTEFHLKDPPPKKIAPNKGALFTCTLLYKRVIIFLCKENESNLE